MDETGIPDDDRLADLLHSPLDDTRDPADRRWLVWGAAGVLVVIGVIVAVVAIGGGDDAAVAPGPATSTSVADTALASSTSTPASTTAPATSVPSTSTTGTTAPSTSGTTPGSTVEEFTAYLDDLVQSGEFSGAVLVARDDEILWSGAAGSADQERDIPNHPGTRFNLMSANKMFTAVGILQLMEQGLLALDGTIGDYLPEYPNEEVKARVTIEHLLTHTSGLGDSFVGDFNADPHRYRSTADYLPLFVDEPLQFPPGEAFGYSNAGYVVLGLIIEELSGVGYGDYLQEHVFEPSGMLATGAPDIEEQDPDLAIGYTTKDIDGNETGVLSANTPLMPGRGFAAGGFYSTVGDLHRFRDALLGHLLLSPESVDLATSGKVLIRDQAWYGYGFFDRIQAGRRVVGHGGGAPGGCSSLSMYPETGYTMVVLSNTDEDCLAVLGFFRDNPPS